METTSLGTILELYLTIELQSIATNMGILYENLNNRNI